jgi:very-short-patch-repair endonuclease
MPPHTETIRARALRNTATPPERLLWTFLRTLRPEGHHFRRQSPFHPYILDFVSHAARLVIEVDGAHHGHELQITHDAVRDSTLARAGYRTLRFQATDVMTNLEGVAIAVREPSPPRHPARSQPKSINDPN